MVELACPAPPVAGRALHTVVPRLESGLALIRLAAWGGKMATKHELLLLWLNLLTFRNAVQLLYLIYKGNAKKHTLFGLHSILWPTLLRSLPPKVLAARALQNTKRILHTCRRFGLGEFSKGILYVPAFCFSAGR